MSMYYFINHRRFQRTRNRCQGDNILIYCHYIGGHQLEYLHHIYMYAYSHPEQKFMFVVPKRFYVDSSKMKWPQCENVSFVDIQNEYKQNNGNRYKQAFYRCLELGRVVKKNSVGEIILIELVSYLPFLPLFVSSHIKVKGILYRIYLYEWKQESLFKRIQDALKYLILSKFKVFDKVFLVNDLVSSRYLNNLYSCAKFCYLPDPVAKIEIEDRIDIRKRYSIDKNKQMILHPGGMLRYKGTIEILKALESLDKEILDRYAFVFAGQVSNDIKKDFYRIKERLERKVQIVLIEGFLPFELLANLFEACDRVLIPYKTKSQSSGIVCHSASFRKPVIVAHGGVIGRTVRDYHLGHLLKEATTEEIIEYLIKYPEWEYTPNNYLAEHSVASFNDSLFN